MFYNRQAVIHNHILHVQAILLELHTLGLLLGGGKCLVVPRKAHHGVIGHRGGIACHKFKIKQFVFTQRAFRRKLKSAYHHTLARRKHIQRQDIEQFVIGHIGCAALEHAVQVYGSSRYTRRSNRHHRLVAAIFEQQRHTLDAHCIARSRQNFTCHPLCKLACGKRFLATRNCKQAAVKPQDHTAVHTLYYTLAHIRHRKGKQQQYQQKQQQRNGRLPVVGKPLHILIVPFEPLVLVHQAVERCIYVIVVAILLPTLRGKRSHRNLVAYIKYIKVYILLEREGENFIAPPR